MNIPRLLANALARRVAVIVVAAALAWLGLAEVRAHSPRACDTEAKNCTLPQAQQAANSLTESQAHCDGRWGAGQSYAGAPVVTHVNNGSSGNFNAAYRCYYVGNGNLLSGSGVETYYYTQGCPAGQFYNPSTQTCTPNCAGRLSEVFTHSQRIPGGSHGCQNGCQFAVSGNGDGTYTRTFGSNTNHCNVLPECLAGEYLNVATSLCMPPEQPCTGQQTKDPVTGVCEDKCPSGMHEGSDGLCVADQDDCPAGQVRAPSGDCLPGDGQCAAGEVRRANGTCGRDSDGDGEADEDDDDPENDPDKEFFSGGDNCASPPSCSGGPIDCGMARIQWRIDCNTRRSVNITGGACGAMPVCVGDNCRAMEHAQLIQQWRAACALEKMAASEDGEGPVGDANRNGVADVLEGRFMPSDGGEDGETTVRTIEVSSGWLDQDNIFGGGSCPAPISFDLMGKSVSSADFEHWCTAMSILRVLILVFGTWTAIEILLGRWL